MATISPTMNIRVGVNPGEDDLSVILATWPNLNGANNVGAAIQLPQHSDRTVQLTGCFNTATVVLEGSLDGNTYQNLTDSASNTLSFTAPGLKQVTEAPLYVRPSVKANGAVTDVGCVLLLRRNAPLTR